MHDETVKAERTPEIPTKIDILAKGLEENSELIDRLETRLLQVLTGQADVPPIDSVAISSLTALGERLAQCDERLNKNNTRLAMILDRLET